MRTLHYTNPVRHMVKRHPPQSILYQLAILRPQILRVTSKRARYIRANFINYLGQFPKHLLETVATQLDKGSEP